MIRSASSSVHASTSKLRTLLRLNAVRLYTLSSCVTTTSSKSRPTKNAIKPTSGIGRVSKRRDDDISGPKKPALRPHAGRPRKAQVRAPREKLLQPYELALRLKQLCNEGKLEAAILYLKSMPLDAQNLAVWNSLIREALQRERYQMAYRIYIDMKRRGFVPSIRTYTTLFGGYSTIKDWYPHTNLLAQVETLHSNYLDYAARIKETDPGSSELSTAPTRAYIRILGLARRYQQMFDVFNAMDEEGPLAPDIFVYSVMLHAVATRTDPMLLTDGQVALRLENASQAKLLWRQLLKFVERNPPAQVDSHIIGSILLALSHGSPPDKLLAFDIARDYLGLYKPGETPKPAIIPLTKHTLQVMLQLCNSAQKYRLTVHFFHQISEQYAETDQPFVEERHVEIVLRALASLSMLSSGEYEAAQALDTLLWLLKEWAIRGRPRDLRPAREHFDLVLSCCYRSGSWGIASHTFEVLTGYNAADFLDDAAKARDEHKRPDRHRPKERPSDPDPAFLSHLVRTAINSGDVANMRQCARMVHCVHPQWDLPREESNLGKPDPAANTRLNVASNLRFWIPRLANDVVEMVDRVVPKSVEWESLAKEQKQWMKLRSCAKSVVREARGSPDKVTKPYLVEDPLGGHQSLTATDNFVEYDMTVRRTSVSRSKR